MDDSDITNQSSSSSAEEKTVEISGAASPKPPTTTESEGTLGESPQEEPPTTQPPSTPPASRWRRFWGYFGKVVGTVFATGSTLLFLLALWDSYRPKITITPGGTLNEKSPFGTYFIVQNQGALPIYNVEYRSQLTMYSPTNGVVNIEQNAMIIPKMQTLESYALIIKYASVNLNPFIPPPTTTNKTADVNHGMTIMQLRAMTLSFDVSYKPKYFWGKRTDTLYFFGMPDVDTNWQWLPSAHESVFSEIVDTNFLPRVQMNPAPVATPTNGSAQIHTKQIKP